MPDPIGVLVIAWMVLGVGCVFAIEFGPSPAARLDRAADPAEPASRRPCRPGNTGRAVPVAGCPQPEPLSTPAADHAGRSWRRRPRLRP